MDFKGFSLKSILFISIAIVFLISFVVIKTYSKPEFPVLEDYETQIPPQKSSIQEAIIKEPPQNTPQDLQTASQLSSGSSNEETAAIQEQLDLDRRQQKQTKELKIRLEQSNLELEQEKVLAQINSFKKDNRGAFNDPALDGQNNLPEIKVDYIGGVDNNKEAILSIGGVSYQVKERSNPLTNIKVLSISTSNVIVHISAPHDLTKTIEFKPE